MVLLDLIQNNPIIIPLIVLNLSIFLKKFNETDPPYLYDKQSSKSVGEEGNSEANDLNRLEKIYNSYFLAPNESIATCSDEKVLRDVQSIVEGWSHLELD